jgi:hypothetical protein
MIYIKIILNFYLKKLHYDGLEYICILKIYVIMYFIYFLKVTKMSCFYEIHNIHFTFVNHLKILI